MDKRIESEESGDEEGKKQAVRLVTDLSQQSLRDEQNGENSTGILPTYLVSSKCLNSCVHTSPLCFL